MVFPIQDLDLSLILQQGELYYQCTKQQWHARCPYQNCMNCTGIALFICPQIWLITYIAIYNSRSFVCQNYTVIIIIIIIIINGFTV